MGTPEMAAWRSRPAMRTYWEFFYFLEGWQGMASDTLNTASSAKVNPLKKTIFSVEGKQTSPSLNEYYITQAAEVGGLADLLSVQSGYRKRDDSALSMTILTDSFEYKSIDQVIPLQPEQVFFMDYTNLDDIKGRHVLEVGLGSGVLSIFCLLNGASYCSGLEINPRAKILTGFNCVLNGVGDRLNIIDGDAKDIFSPLRDKQFDFIYSNPPFEPTPPGMEYYFNSAAGIYGLTFVEELLKGINGVLNDGGTFQMVTMAPGDRHSPFMLHEMIEQYLPGAEVEIVLDLQPISYAGFVDRFVDIFKEDNATIDQMKDEAARRGVTHLHMLILKYKKGMQGGVKTSWARKTYESWQSPLGTTNELYLEVA
ncbi:MULTISPECIES: methyltransferase [unclassified Janthinobacterium]|uniref:methyltransferase n=1 Tax=unclassified Janthinobacterium TaxID=2610881 RepID=UPI0025B1D351|nr:MULTISPECIES: methyltransferase [unclassified Janthinobacterium]MDN2715179.1 methyltransferase [Janthinobacterium sp. SUN120]MDO8052397.1 methyltransferase [Janthinobacterium sp. SUN211]